MLRVAIALAALGWVYWPTLRELFDTWMTHPEYSHGPLVPVFALFLLYKRNSTAPASPPRPWPIVGYTALVFAIALRFVGSATSFLPLEGLSLILCLGALAALAGGRAALVRFWPPLVFLLFMLPLPYEASRLLGGQLQTIGTIATTYLLQCFGQPAIAEGNRILIGSVTLNVVEACSGLRMLVTFIAFATAAVFMMDRHWLVKGLVLASAVPIALLTNILRITATGLAHVWMHDGDDKTRLLEFIHDFNGWMMMPVGLLFLMLELWLFKHLLIERNAASVQRSTVNQQKTTKRQRFVSVIQMPMSR
ncbi:MAG TPA: exosortase/archaeosortase family protein [Gemmataceae bacterium]|jgi:exosortase|nr:exosortase/archaeosortase family protein [Gemmataceae bacterium]